MAAEFFCNPTEAFCVAIQSFTTDVTGSLFLTLLLIIFGMILVAALFRIPMEMTVILVLPTLIVFASFTNGFLSILGAALIYAGVIFAKNIFIQ